MESGRSDDGVDHGFAGFDNHLHGNGDRWHDRLRQQWQWHGNSQRHPRHTDGEQQWIDLRRQRAQSEHAGGGRCDLQLDRAKRFQFVVTEPVDCQCEHGGQWDVLCDCDGQRLHQRARVHHRDGQPIADDYLPRQHHGIGGSRPVLYEHYLLGLGHGHSHTHGDLQHWSDRHHVAVHFHNRHDNGQLHGVEWLRHGQLQLQRHGHQWCAASNRLRGR